MSYRFERMSFEAPTRSLFRQVLNWTLLPFLVLWPLSLVVVYKIAMVVADQPYDAALADRVRALSGQVMPTSGREGVDLSVPLRAAWPENEGDITYFQILGPRREWIAGDPELPLGALPPHPRSGEIYFRNDQIGGRDVRVAFQFLKLESAPLEWVQIQVAQTRNKRKTLAYQIIAGVVLPQLAMLPVAVWLLFLGLRRGLLPLSDLQHRISKRRSNDLSPIETTRVPHELRPLIGAFNAMMKRLEANVAAQKRFIADAAHQIRTPLTGLKMQTELALTETDPDHLRRILPMLALSTGRACHLINQLLLLARAESTSALSVFKQFVDLEALFVETASLHLGQARAKQIELEFRRPTVPVRIKGDPLMLSELLKNLLDNAIKYTPSGGRIRISLSAAESAVLEIQDSGIGIPAADRPHVFERFYRVIGTPAEGSGLGLAIVREIANHHRAEVELLDNPEGTGCRVRVVFPLALAPAANTSAPENLSGIHLSSGEPYPKQASA